MFNRETLEELLGEVSVIRDRYKGQVIDEIINALETAINRVNNELRRGNTRTQIEPSELGGGDGIREDNNTTEAKKNPL